jgi:hypothetical protein
LRVSPLVLVPGLLVAAASDEGQHKPATRAEQYQALLKEYQEAAQASWKATTDDERKKLVARVDKLPPGLLELAEEAPKDPLALDALTQVVSLVVWVKLRTEELAEPVASDSSHPSAGKDSPMGRALAILVRDHVRSDKLGEVCRRSVYGFQRECDAFLRAVLEMSPHRDVQAQACLGLAQFHHRRLQRLDLIKDRPDLVKCYESLFGKDYLEESERQDRAKVVSQVEALFEQAAARYGDVSIYSGGTVGERVKSELFEIRHLAVGMEAQDIEGEDQDGKRFKLSDYRGKVVLLYFWQLL